jgi:hypothetical protein
MVVIPHRRFRTSYNSHLQWSKYPTTIYWPLKMGPISCPETSERNYHFTLRNIPQGRRPYIFRTGAWNHASVSPLHISGEYYVGLWVWISQKLATCIGHPIQWLKKTCPKYIARKVQKMHENIVLIGPCRVKFDNPFRCTATNFEVTSTGLILQSFILVFCEFSLCSGCLWS